MEDGDKRMEVKTRIISFLNPISNLKKAAKVREHFGSLNVKRFEEAKRKHREENTPVVITFRMQQGKII